MGRKHCGKRRNCSLRAISPFPAVFLKDLYCRHVKTRACLGKGSDTNCIENIVGKGEIAHFEQFHLFPLCFSKAFSSLCSNEYIWSLEERVNKQVRLTECSHSKLHGFWVNHTSCQVFVAICCL